MTSEPSPTAQAILHTLHGYLDAEQKGGATVVRISAVRDIMLGLSGTVSNGR